MADIPTSLRVPTQLTLDEKLYFKNLSDVSNLGDNNNLAFSYYKDMIVFCSENKTLYIWSEATDEMDNITKLLNNNFIYPNGLVENGIDYSNKQYNFYNYLEFWLSSNGYCRCNENDNNFTLRFRPSLLKIMDKEGLSLDGDFRPGQFNNPGASKELKLSYKINIFYTENVETFISKITIYREDTDIVLMQVQEQMTLPAYPGEFLSESIFDFTFEYQANSLYRAHLVTKNQDGSIIKEEEKYFIIVE